MCIVCQQSQDNHQTVWDHMCTIVGLRGSTVHKRSLTHMQTVMDSPSVPVGPWIIWGLSTVILEVHKQIGSVQGSSGIMMTSPTFTHPLFHDLSFNSQSYPTCRLCCLWSSTAGACWMWLPCWCFHYHLAQTAAAEIAWWWLGLLLALTWDCFL